MKCEVSETKQTAMKANIATRLSSEPVSKMAGKNEKFEYLLLVGIGFPSCACVRLELTLSL